MTDRLTKTIDRQAWMKFFTHLTVILMIFVLPELMFRASKTHWRDQGLWTWLFYAKTAIFLAVFYLNYYVLIGRLLFGEKRRLVAFLLSNLGIIILATVGIYLMQHGMIEPDDGPRHFGRHPEENALIRNASFFLRDISMLVLTIGLSMAMRFGEKWGTIEQRHQQMLASQKAEELENLKSQLNPHFLFNTLNTIYALIAINPEKAQDAVHQLSALLRYVLYENPATVPLSQEIEFVKSYISLMQMRMASQPVVAHFDPGSDVEVAPLLFISIIENAFKHGNTGKKTDTIEISITASPDGTVKCLTRNHFISPAKPSRTGGIGMANLRRRLQLLYPGKSELLTSTNDDIYTASLTIQLQ